MTHSRHVQVSDLLADFSLYDRETITVQDLLDQFGERAFGALMLVFAAPLILPMPPGLSAVLGAPLVFITAQLMVGRQKLWLPKFVSQRPIRHRDFIAIADKVLPYLRKLEQRLKPRMTWVLAPVAERLIGAVALVLAVIVFLPIPFGNMLPSLAIAVLGLGIVERDGLATLIGWLTAVASVALLAFVSKALAAATVTFFTTLLAPF